jgi:hypothetical protein
MLNYRNQLFHDIDASALPKVDKLELKINIIINALNGSSIVYKQEYDRAIKLLRQLESDYVKSIRKENGNNTI